MAKKTIARKKKPARPVTRGKAKKSVKSVKAARPAKTVKKITKPVDLGAEIKSLEQKIQKAKQQLTELRKRVPLQPVQDYLFKAHDGSEIRLSQLFGDKRDLILVHNMGKGCNYCTLWADGFTGFTKHLENRAGFVVISKDPHDIQRDFYNSRGWNFRMYSSNKSTFNRDMGYENERGNQMPGVSAFHKDESGQIFRSGSTWFGPGDDFCAVWPMLDLLKDGPKNWQPRFQY
jgi:predicted dithiol-disulfide oxidoreductase (DUF899 family)